eukprot:TRINITY_DN6702_c0_g1_i1.p1 TRINITY_DN6702_c0_g1~~TRINITY_DN6702_c0_g1_i1.p1  ORF type:complete len:338 (-),score=73.57 TRINITY_DN6702_c0_g1_i1:161-1174(-)
MAKTKTKTKLSKHNNYRQEHDSFHQIKESLQTLSAFFPKNEFKKLTQSLLGSDGDLLFWTSNSFQTLMTDRFVPLDYLKANAEPLTRVIYDQPLNISGFAGMVSILPGVTTAFSVLGGNSLLVEKMFRVSNSSVNLKTTVKNIHYDADKQKYSLSASSRTKQYEYDGYDAVIIATPIEFAQLNLTGFTVPSLSHRHYQHWFVILVRATGLSPAYFGLPPNATVPDNIFTLGNSSAPFNVITVRSKSPLGGNVYKIFSNQNLTLQLPKIFTGYQESHVQHWPFTFPDLPATSSFQPIIFNPNLIYLGTLESAATAMECAVISGRNAAYLLKSSLKSSK